MSLPNVLKPPESSLLGDELTPLEWKIWFDLLAKRISAPPSILTIEPSTTSSAKLRLPHGSAPSAPVNGDMWTTSAGLFVRINGVTVGPLS